MMSSAKEATTPALRLDLFRGVDESLWRPALEACEARDCAAGQVLLRPGEVNASVYLLVSGELHVRLGENEFTIEAGQSFGEMSVIDGGQVSAAVMAIRDARVVVVPADTFWAQFMTIPGVARNVLTLLVKRLRTVNDGLLVEQRQRILYERLQQELAAAREIQSAMLPSRLKLFPGCAEVDAAGAMFPAVDVAGDFFDACEVNPAEMFFAVGDVSGKGVGAALLMAKTVPLLRLEATRLRTVEEIVGTVNDALSENNPQCMFVTLGCGVLDITDGRFTYASAGHVPPVLLPKRGEPRFLDVPHDIALGVMGGEKFEVRTTILRPGDLLLLYSDGVTEAFNNRNEAFGSDRLLAALRGQNGMGATEIVAWMKLAVEAFAGPETQSDDIALLAVRYLGDGEERTSMIRRPSG